MKFYDYQNIFLNDNSRLQIYNKSRQIGMSFAVGYRAVRRASTKKRDILLVSASYRQSKELNFICNKWIDVFNLHGMNLVKSKDTQEEIHLAGAGRIFSLPSNPETVRGFHGDVVLDEFALHNNQQAIYEALLPSILRGYTVTIISTPLGQNDLFHEIFTNENKYPDFVRYQTDIYQAKAQGFDIDIDLIKKNMDEESFLQEFCCQFVDESTSYFPYSLIKANISDMYGMDFSNAQNFMGVDIGRKSDLSVIAIISVLNGHYFLRDIIAVKDAKYSHQHAIIEKAINDYSIVKGGIDATGIGNQIAEEINEKYSFIVPYNFTGPLKEMMVTSLKKSFEINELSIPDDRYLIADIHAIKKSVTSSNNIKFDAIRTDKGHADRFSALLIALDNAKLRNFDLNILTKKIQREKAGYNYGT